MVFIDNLQKDVRSSAKLFADDAKIYSRIRDKEDVSGLQEDLNRLKEWSEKWLVGFNKENCKVMHIGRSNPRYDSHTRDTEETRRRNGSWGAHYQQPEVHETSNKSSS